MVLHQKTVGLCYFSRSNERLLRQDFDQSCSKHYLASIELLWFDLRLGWPRVESLGYLHALKSLSSFLMLFVMKNYFFIKTWSLAAKYFSESLFAEYL